MKKINGLKEKLVLIPIFLVMYLLLFLTNSTCLIRLITQIPCPFCGMTRAVLSLLSLNISAAFSYHPMVWSLPILLIYLLYDGEPTRSRLINLGVALVIAIGFLLVWVLRLCGILAV